MGPPQASGSVPFSHLMDRAKARRTSPPVSEGLPGTDVQVVHCTRMPPQGQAAHTLVIIYLYIYLDGFPRGGSKSPHSD